MPDDLTIERVRGADRESDGWQIKHALFDVVELRSTIGRIDWAVPKASTDLVLSWFTSRG